MPKQIQHIPQSLKETLENLPESNHQANNITSLAPVTNNLSDTIQNLLLSGKSNNYIIDLLVSGKITNGDKFTQSQARNAIYVIKKQMKATFNENKEYLESDLYEKFENLYAKSYEAGDFKECRECLKDIMKLSGIGTNGNSVQINKPDENITITFS